MELGNFMFKLNLKQYKFNKLHSFNQDLPNVKMYFYIL